MKIVRTKDQSWEPGMNKGNYGGRRKPLGGHLSEREAVHLSEKQTRRNILMGTKTRRNRELKPAGVVGNLTFS